MSPGDFSERKSDTQGKTNNISEISTTRPWFFTRWMGWFGRTFRYLTGDNLDDNPSNPPKVNSDTESQPEGIKIYIPAGVVTSRQLKVILESSLPGMYSVQLRRDLFTVTVRKLPKPDHIGDSPWPPSSASEAILESGELGAFIRKIKMEYMHAS